MDDDSDDVELDAMESLALDAEERDITTVLNELLKLEDLDINVKSGAQMILKYKLAGKNLSTAIKAMLPNMRYDKEIRKYAKALKGFM